MGYQQSLLLLAFLAAGMASCKKDKEGTPPVITILSPGDASTLAIPDTLLVTVQTSDDQRVEQVTASLLDANYVPVGPHASAVPIGNPATLTLALPVTSEQLESGTYKILATATDGELSAKDVHTIQITAAPLRLRSVFAVTTPSASSVSLYRIDSTGQVTVGGTFNMDLGGAAIGSLAQRLFLAGSTTGPFLALDVDHLAERWQRPNLSGTGIPWFTSVDLCTDGRVYAGDGSGTLHGYQAIDGTGVLTAVLPEGYRCEQALAVNGLLVCSVRQFVTQMQQVALFQISSGAQQGTFSLDLIPVRMFQRDATHALIFGNSAGVGRVQDLNVIGGGSWEAYVWQSAITAAEQVGSSTWVVALADGDLQRFTYDNDGSLSIGHTAVLNDLSYDPASGALFGAADGQVLAVDPASGNILSSFAVNGPVRKVLPLRNR